MGTSIGNSNAIPFNKSRIRNSAMKSLILWYDIAKQQATNEGMAATPMLRDLSGNGHDATCYNFAWSGMSGIGGYAISPFNNWIANTNVTFTVQSNYKCTIVSGSSGKQSLGIRASYYNNFILNISISNINSSQVSIYMLQGDDVADIRCTITKEGTYAINLEYNEQASYNQVLISGLCTVEILPEYPNALVSDGVDDYAMVQNKYAVDFTYKNKYNSLWLINSSRATGTIEKSKITITSISNLSIQVYYQCTNSQIAFNVPKTKVKITGLTDGQTMSYYASSPSFEEILIDSDGIYELPTFESNGNGMYYGFRCNKLQDTCNITIEQLPINKSLILTKEQGFTVLAKRKWIGDINSHSQGFASKISNASFVDGAFCFEGVEGSGSAPFNRTFDNLASGGATGVNYISSFVDDDFTFMTSKRYNSVEFKNIGDGVDTDALAIFRLATETNNFYSNIALYSFLLFDRDLTDNEIEWVKKNMIEGGGVMKYDWARRPWKAYFSEGGDNRGTGSVTSYRLTVNAVRSLARVFETIVSLPSMQSYRIKVSNLPEGVSIYYSGHLNNKETNILTISKDGIYEIPPIETNSIYIGFRFDKKFENENVIIQQLLS